MLHYIWGQYNTYLLVYILWLNLQLISSLRCLDCLISNFAAVFLQCIVSNSSVAFALFHFCLNNIRSLGTKHRWTACNGFSLHAAWIIDALIAWVFMDTKRLFLFSVQHTARILNSPPQWHNAQRSKLCGSWTVQYSHPSSSFAYLKLSLLNLTMRTFSLLILFLLTVNFLSHSKMCMLFFYHKSNFATASLSQA